MGIEQPLFRKTLGMTFLEGIKGKVGNNLEGPTSRVSG